jgi:hypothetical protein
VWSTTCAKIFSDIMICSFSCVLRIYQKWELSQQISWDNYFSHYLLVFIYFWIKTLSFSTYFSKQKHTKTPHTVYLLSYKNKKLVLIKYCHLIYRHCSFSIVQVSFFFCFGRQSQTNYSVSLSCVLSLLPLGTSYPSLFVSLDCDIWVYWPFIL